MFAKWDIQNNLDARSEKTIETQLELILTHSLS